MEMEPTRIRGLAHCHLYGASASILPLTVHTHNNQNGAIMPQMSSITLSDTSVDPAVDHVFDPITLVNNVGEYRELSELSYLLQNNIAVTVRPPTPNNWGHRVTWKLTVPVVPKKSNEDECCVPAGAVVRTDHVTIEFFLDKTSPLATGETLVALLQALVADPQFTATALGQGLR